MWWGFLREGGWFKGWALEYCVVPVVSNFIPIISSQFSAGAKRVMVEYTSLRDTQAAVCCQYTSRSCVGYGSISRHKIAQQHLGAVSNQVHEDFAVRQLGRSLQVFKRMQEKTRPQWNSNQLLQGIPHEGQSGPWPFPTHQLA